jgi:hypothetical protein
MKMIEHKEKYLMYCIEGKNGCNTGWGFQADGLQYGHQREPRSVITAIPGGGVGGWIQLKR